MTKAMDPITAYIPPYIRAKATNAATVNATKAVINHPLITVSTPVMR